MLFAVKFILNVLPVEGRAFNGATSRKESSVKRNLDRQSFDDLKTESNNINVYAANNEFMRVIMNKVVPKGGLERLILSFVLFKFKTVRISSTLASRTKSA